MSATKFTLEHSSPFYCGLKDEHDCWCNRTKSIHFLDTKLYVENGKITTDLYRKPTYRFISNNIPFSFVGLGTFQHFLQLVPTVKKVKFQVAVNFKVKNRTFVR